MQQNIYDDEEFFAEYANMSRSQHGLDGAGEWHELKALIPDLQSKHVLDLGCGFGWHCRYARKQHAASVIGVDISEKMLNKARELTNDQHIKYINLPIEEMAFSDEQFDVVISSLALYYVESVDKVFGKVNAYLKPGGSFIMSVEHPIFTARSEQDWWYDDGNRLHWPVDNYQDEGLREATFLNHRVVKYHRTVSTYINALLETGFNIRAVREPLPSEKHLQSEPDMKDELRRPMFLIILAEK